MISIMVDKDSAFLWESEALRDSAPRHRPKPGRHVREALDDDWLTLRQTSDVTGIPVPTLRKWARRESVPTYLQDTAVGQLRMVSLDGVYERAAVLGRTVEHNPTPKPTPPVPTPKRETKPTQNQTPAPTSEKGTATPPSPPEVPEGTMLVPLDAWNKMLNQLGNLHQAGQDLAEARERAAKAETESKFLRERLAELRSDSAAKPEHDVQTRNDLRQSQPLVHIPIEGDGEESDEIPIRDLGEPAAPAGEHPDVLSLTTYSIEMVKHLYSTWRGRPRR